MSDPVLLQEDHGAVRTLTLNRPDKRNALNTALTRALVAALDAAEAERDVRAVVLAGAGAGFCAGADLKEFAELTPDQAERVSERADLTHRLQSILHVMRKPVIAAVHGAAVGGGAGIALSSDLIVAGEDVRIGFPELRHQIVPALVMPALQRSIGRKLAFEMIALGRFLDAREARAEGIVNRVVPNEQVIAQALELAQACAQTDPQAMAAAKRLFYRVADLPFPAAMEAGRDVNTMMRSFRQ